MVKRLLVLVAFLSSSMVLATCSDTTSSTNSNANTTTIGTRTEPTVTATATPTPRYTEEQAREEREKAKASKETIGQSLEDAWVHTKVVAQLISDSKTPERNINVDVVDGTVTLRGQVDTAEAKSEAERLAKETDGVKSVKNELKVVAAKGANTNKATPNKKATY